MKKVYKRAASLVTVILLSFFLTTFANADANRIGDYVLNGGVGNWGYTNRYYFITSSASSYEAKINAAMDSWIYTTARLGVSTSISWLRTYTQSVSVMDIYYGSYFGPTVLGATSFWIYSTQINPRTSNWGWGKIQLNQDGFSLLSDNDKQGTIAHEMGHVFGLDETNNDVYSIMCQKGAGRLVYEPQVGDLRPIQQMYP